VSSLHPATLNPDDLLRDCDITRSRASGPGGQHRNKVETAVTIKHRPTGVSASANERRSQEQNRRVAVFRLRVNLAVEVRATVDAANLPSDLWRSRLDSRTGRIACNPTHDDYPALLAEALDVLAASDFDPRSAAERLECSVSQLVKLLRAEPKALAVVNRERAKRGGHALR